MMVNLCDLNLLHQAIIGELEAIFHSTVSKGNFILGEEVFRFENTFADYHGCCYGVSLNSGTDALILALKAIGVAPNDEVIIPAMTFISTAEAIVWLGARPVLTDVDSDTLLVTPEQVESVISERTKAIIPVHLHGYPVPLDRFLSLTEDHELIILEDCAQAHGAREHNYPVGSRSSGGCFSFFPGKNLGALGDGGMFVTNEETLANKVRALRNHGRVEKYMSSMIGCNSRLDELQAAFLNVKLQYVEQWNEQRRQLAKAYHIALADLPLKLPSLGNQSDVPVFHQYVIRCESKKIRTQLAHYLKTQNISTGIHYPIPLHLQTSLQYLGYKTGSFPNSEDAANCILSLPLYPGMTCLQQEYVVEKIRKFFQQID